VEIKKVLVAIIPKKTKLLVRFVVHFGDGHTEEDTKEWDGRTLVLDFDDNKTDSRITGKGGSA
jgi:hypothetical protein